MPAHFVCPLIAPRRQEQNQQSRAAGRRAQPRGDCLCEGILSPDAWRTQHESVPPCHGIVPRHAPVCLRCHAHGRLPHAVCFAVSRGGWHRRTRYLERLVLKRQSTMHAAFFSTSSVAPRPLASPRLSRLSQALPGSPTSRPPRPALRRSLATLQVRQNLLPRSSWHLPALVRAPFLANGRPGPPPAWSYLDRMLLRVLLVALAGRAALSTTGGWVSSSDASCARLHSAWRHGKTHPRFSSFLTLFLLVLWPAGPRLSMGARRTREAPLFMAPATA